MRTKEERFWQKVKKTKTCWVWQAATVNGYGSFNSGNKITISAHRFSFILKFGKVPSGLHIDHKCMNKLCVKPSHLEAVTQATNNKRKWKFFRKKNCPKGHKFTKENTRYNKHGWRICKKCRQLRYKEFGV